MHVYQRHIHAEGDDSLSRIARLVPAGSRVLDVGCGSGALGRYLSANLKCTVDGITHNPDEATEAAVGHRSIKVLDLDTQVPSSAFEPASYDVIVCADVLEHVRRSEAVLQDLRVLLAPQGKVLLSLPNVTHTGVVLSLISGKFVPTYEGLLDATHLHFFDRTAVERLAAQSGFSIAHLERVVRSLPQTEFGALNADALPTAVREFLLSGEEGSTYQFIAELLPLSRAVGLPRPLPLPTRPLIAQKPQFAAQIYWRADGPYLEESSRYSFGEIGLQRQTVTFSLPADISAVSHLRLDPADRPGVFELWAVTILDSNAATLWAWDGSYSPHLQLNGLAYLPVAQPLAGGGHAFVATTDDPWLELPVPEHLRSQLAGASVKLEMSWPRSADFAAFSYANSVYASRLERADAQSAELSRTLRLEQLQRAREQRAFDDQSVKQAHHISELERKIQASEVSLQAFASRAAQDKQQAQASLAAVEAALSNMRAQLQTALATLSYRETEVERLYRSRSWRFTKLLRGLERMARVIVRRPNVSTLPSTVEPAPQAETLLTDSTPRLEAAPSDAPGSLFGSIDRLIIGHRALYAIGWSYHTSSPVIAAVLVFGDLLQGTQSIALSIGVARPDVQATNPHWLNAANSGWFSYGGISADTELSTTTHLVIELASGEKITRDVSSEVEWQSDQPSPSDRSAEDLFAKAPPQVPLVIDHSMGGGANAYSKQLVVDLLSRNDAVMLLSFETASLNYRLQLVTAKRIEIANLRSPQDLLPYAHEKRFGRIIFNNAVSFPRAEEVPEWLLGLTEAAEAPLVICMHDYFAICPSSFLLDSNSRYCDVPSLDKCRSCLPAIEQPMVRLYSGAGLEAWRAAWGRCLSAAEVVVCFSESSRRLLLKAYPQLPAAKLSLEPHRVALPPAAQLLQIKRQISLDTIRLGVVGHISEHKGSAVVARLQAAILRRRLSLPITVVGSFEASTSDLRRGGASEVGIHVTGSYKPQELAQTLAAQGINLIFFPSICPETFSYVLHELRALNLPIIAFDLGAQADIVGQAANGLVLPLALADADSADRLLDSILEFSSKLSTDQKATEA